MPEKNSIVYDIKLSGLSLFILSTGAGAYIGYCDAHGIPFKNENVELALTYGPALVQGSLTAIRAGWEGLFSGNEQCAAVLTGISDCEDIISKEDITNANNPNMGRSITGFCLGGVTGAVLGGIETLIGYGVGYLMGSLTK